MATTINLKKLLDIPRWHPLSNTENTAAGGFSYATANDVNNLEMVITGTSTGYIYSAAGDALLITPAPGTTFPTMGPGCCSTAINVGPTGACPFNGTTTQFQINETIRSALKGYKVLITSGPAAGDIREISGNTMGPNGTIYVKTPFSTALTTASNYRLLTPRFYFHVSSSTSGAFQVFDYVTFSWILRTASGISFSSEGQMTSTDTFFCNDFVSYATGTATGGSGTTLENTSKNWTANQFVNAQIRITAGTGAGQIRTITSNSATSITVGGWSTIPDNTSQYSIEGNQDHIYVGGVGSTAVSRYSVSSNSWTSVAVRPTVTGTNGTFLHIYQNKALHWNVENSLLNGRYIYAPRNGAIMDVYDIALNTWSSISTVYLESNSTSVGWATDGNKIYFLNYRNSSINKVFEVDPANGTGFIPINTLAISSGLGSIAGGKRLRVHTFKDGNTEVKFLYYHVSNGNIQYRLLLI